MIKLSFVLPCFNVDNYLQRCIDSILKLGINTPEYEIICVDDCSNDKTPIIIQDYANKYSNIKAVFLPQKRYLGGARNVGLRESKGKYIWFVDSDDTVAKDTSFHKILNETIDLNLDVLCFNYHMIDSYGNLLSEHKVFPNIHCLEGINFIKTVFGDSIVYNIGYVWRFLYKKEFLTRNNMCFPEGSHWEDTVYMPKALLLSKRTASIDTCLYEYRVNPESISGTFAKFFPGKSIFDFSFCAGCDLLELSDSIEDEKIRHSFRNTAITKYINGFPVFLCRTSSFERRKFYQLVTVNQKKVESVHPYLNKVSSLFLLQNVGLYFASLVSVCYKLSHKKKN